MVLEDYTLKHVWGPKTQQAYPFKGSRQDSDPDQGSRRHLHISGIQPRGNSHGLLVKGRERAGGKLPERFSQRQKKPDPGQALRPFLRSCLFSSRSHKDCSVRDPPSGIAKSRGDRSALAQPGSHTIQTRGLNRSLIRLRDPIKDPTDMQSEYSQGMEEGMSEMSISMHVHDKTRRYSSTREKQTRLLQYKQVQ